MTSSPAPMRVGPGDLVRRLTTVQGEVLQEGQWVVYALDELTKTLVLKHTQQQPKPGEGERRHTGCIGCHGKEHVAYRVWISS